MSDTKHTPGGMNHTVGEWSMVLIPEEGYSVFGRTFDRCVVTIGEGIKSEEIAKMLVASKKMYEALKFLECVYRKNFVPEGEVSTTLDFIRSTISEARGEQE